jgi:hypothetical protein
VLDGYAQFLQEKKFLQDKKLALDKHQPYLVRWVREFLLFARAHAGYSFEQTLKRFLAEAGACARTCCHLSNGDHGATWEVANLPADVAADASPHRRQPFLNRTGRAVADRHDPTARQTTHTTATRRSLSTHFLEPRLLAGFPAGPDLRPLACYLRALMALGPLP